MTEIDGVLGPRSPGLEFRILCLEGSVISFISSSSGCSPGQVSHKCAQRWLYINHIHFISFQRADVGVFMASYAYFLEDIV